MERSTAVQRRSAAASPAAAPRRPMRAALGAVTPRALLSSQKQPRPSLRHPPSTPHDMTLLTTDQARTQAQAAPLTLLVVEVPQAAGHAGRHVAAHRAQRHHGAACGAGAGGRCGWVGGVGG